MNRIIIKYKHHFLFFFLILLLSGCKKDSDFPPANMCYRYFPVNSGHWAIYQVDSIAWDAFFGTVDTFQFQIKEIIESKFTDNEGRLAIRIERYKRLNDTSQWVIKDVWFANRTSTTLEKVEENIRLVKLIFPVKDGEKWNGNKLNSLGNQDYEYIEANKPYQLASFSFDSSLTVLQKDQNTFISRDYSIEVYATGIGLVYKKFIEVEIKYPPPPGEIINGRDYSYTLLEWGD